MSAIVVDGQVFTEQELIEQALAADPEQTIPDDAVPLATFRGAFAELLPDWYMPTVTGTPRRRGRTMVFAGIITFSLLFINALGLCITYGRLEVPF